jgi:hypothetical protein
MCRMLGIQTDVSFDPTPWIRAFAEHCEASQEYQGHGWGVTWWTDHGWRRYRTLRPIWEDRFAPPPTTGLLVHARSAFRNEGIELDNNMPFVDEGLAFAFNGELHGVRLAIPGDTGAARLFRLLGRFVASGDGDQGAALRRLDQVVTGRSRYVRALNLLVANRRDLIFSTRFGEDEDYFTMHATTLAAGEAGPGMRIVASEPLRAPRPDAEWRPLPNGVGGTLAPDGSLRLWGDSRHAGDSRPSGDSPHSGDTRPSANDDGSPASAPAEASTL